VSKKEYQTEHTVFGFIVMARDKTVFALLAVLVITRPRPNPRQGRTVQVDPGLTALAFSA